MGGGREEVPRGRGAQDELLQELDELEQLEIDARVRAEKGGGGGSERGRKDGGERRAGGREEEGGKAREGRREGRK